MGWNKRDCAFFWSLFASLGCLISFVVVLIVKVDSNSSINWYEVFVPLWAGLMIGSLWIAYLFLWLIDKRSSRYGAVSWLMFAELSFAVFLILVAIRIENPEKLDNCSWALVFIPFWCTLILLLLIDKDWPDYKGEYNPGYVDMWDHVSKVAPINLLGCLAAFSILLVIRLDVQHDLSWAIIFIPWWYLSFVYISVIYIFYIEENEGFWCLIFLIPLAIALSFLIPLQFYLSGSFALLTYAFIPLFGVVAILVFALCGLCCVYICGGCNSDD